MNWQFGFKTVHAWNLYGLCGYLNVTRGRIMKRRTADELRSMLNIAMAFAQATESIEQHILENAYRHDESTRLSPGISRSRKDMWMALKTASHFNLHQALELSLKFILRLEGVDHENLHFLNELYDKLSPKSQEEVHRAYRRMIDSVENYETTGIGFYYGDDPPQMPNVPIDTAMQGFEDLDKHMKLHLRRYSYEDIGRGELTMYFLDLDGWIEFFNDISEYAHRLFREKNSNVRCSASFGKRGKAE